MLDFVFYKYVGMQYTNFNISIWAAKGVAWYTGDVSRWCIHQIYKGSKG